MKTNAQPAEFRKGQRRIRPSNNPAKNDDIVAKWNRQVTARYANLKAAITITIVKNDAFGLQARNVATPAPVGAFARGTDATRIQGFMAWLERQERAGVIQIVQRPGRKSKQPWTDTLIRQNFTRGGVVASQEVSALVTGTPTGLGVSIPTIGASGQGLINFMTQPQSASRIRIIQSRTWTGMKGITAQMNSQIRDVLADGILAGRGASQIARDINGRVDAIGEVRARMIARTESNQAYNEAALVEYDNVSGIIGETVLSQWWATRDFVTRASHRRRHGKVFEQADAQLLIGEPNCRCALLPYIESIEGKAEVSKSESFLANVIAVDYWLKEWPKCACCG